MQHPPHLALGTHIIQCTPHQPPHHLNGMALRPPAHLAHAQLQLAPSQTPSQVVGSSKLHSGAKPFIPNSQLQKNNGHQQSFVPQVSQVQRQKPLQQHNHQQHHQQHQSSHHQQPQTYHQQSNNGHHQPRSNHQRSQNQGMHQINKQYTNNNRQNNHTNNTNNTHHQHSSSNNNNHNENHSKPQRKQTFKPSNPSTQRPPQHVNQRLQAVPSQNITHQSQPQHLQHHNHHLQQQPPHQSQQQQLPPPQQHHHHSGGQQHISNVYHKSHQQHPKSSSTPNHQSRKSFTQQNGFTHKESNGFVKKHVKFISHSQVHNIQTANNVQQMQLINAINGHGGGPIPVVSVADHQTEHSIIEHLPEVSIINAPTIISTPPKPKEKTSMCLVNELSRYNGIQHQYHLTLEDGPAHCKVFTVTLKLGDEEYTAEGPSIKKAQHKAAAEAVAKTNFQHPPPKTSRPRGKENGNMCNITPTVELNALAMKIGQTPVYNFGGIEQQPISQIPVHMTTGNTNGKAGRTRASKFHNRANPNGTIDICKISLTVGNYSFNGSGPSFQAAKHDAATRALAVLKPIYSNATPSESTNDSFAEDPNGIKSPISLVHEMALKRELNVAFQVKNEEGPPHMRIFTTACIVGSIVVEAEGHGKKTSKKRAAIKMIEELKKIPISTPAKIANLNSSKKVKGKEIKKKSPTKIPASGVVRKKKNIIKDKDDMAAESNALNPISRLIQIQQALKEKEPEYTLIEEKGSARKREFTIEVMASGQSALGSGNNKKKAKQEAAKNLLKKLGYECSIISDEVLSGDECKRKDKKQPSEGKPSRKKIDLESKDCDDEEDILCLEINGREVTAKEKLMHYAEWCNFKLSYEDYTKGNHSDFLSIVMLQTDPDVISHGAGKDKDSAQEKASLTALEQLAKIGLQNIQPKTVLPEEQNNNNVVALEAPRKK